jgi:hypothetical protein
MLVKDMSSVTIPLRHGLNNHYTEMRRVLLDESSTHEELGAVLDKLISIATLFKSEIQDHVQFQDMNPSL